MAKRKWGRASKRGQGDSGTESEVVEDDQQFPAWLKEPTGAAIAALFTAGGLLTFVAAVGGAIVWVRFYAAQLPADQALAALPRGELIASGAVLLAAFLVLGLAAVVGVYILDVRSAQKGGSGIFQALLGLFTAEALVIVALAVDAESIQRLVAAETVVLLAALAFAVSRWRQSLMYEKQKPEKEPGDAKRTGNDADNGRWSYVVLIVVLIVPSVVVTQVNEVWASTAASLASVLLVAGLVAVEGWVNSRFERGAYKSEPARRDQLRKSRGGKVAIGALVVPAVALPALILGEWWIAVALTAAAGLALACGIVATGVNRKRFMLLRLGVAVFVSVPLLGAIAGIARNLDEPQVQPVAFIRRDDGIAEAIQGIYVTETSDRLYFANVATDRCTDNVKPRSGRLLWVPRKEIVTMALGPPQSVDDAGTKALEMYYALAPGAVNAAIASTVRAKAARARAASVEDGPPRRRLEDIGPALRRDFDLDPNLSSTSAEVGDSVTLGNRSGKGEKDKDDGIQHTLRVGSVEAPTVDERTANGHLPWSKDGELEFEVPEGAQSGLVTVECGGFATEPYLSVRKQPTARIRLDLRPGTREAVLDGSRSKDRDAGRITASRWRIDGKVAGTKRRVELPIPSGNGLHRVSLEVIDDDRDRDIARIWLWRRVAEAPRPRRLTLFGLSLPLSLSLPGEIVTALREPNAELHVYVHRARSGRADRRVAPMLRRLRRALALNRLGYLYIHQRRLPPADPHCPASGRRGDAYVEIYAIDPGVTLQLPKDCPSVAK